jgi:hypothetical protein
MSQDTFPFDAGDDHVAQVDEGKRNRKAMFVAGGVAAALVVAAGGYFLLSGGGDDSVSLAAAPHVTVHHAAAAPAAAPAAKPVKKLPTAYTANLGRDPFKALYVVPAAAPAGQAPAPQPAAAAPATGAGPTAGGSTGTKPYALKLVAISKPSPESRFFSWTVDGTKATVLPAQRFGKYGEIVVLAYERSSTGAATGAIIQVGDDSPVDVAIGDVINVL